MNDTLQSFGYPGNTIKEYDYWVVLLRPKQVTVGSLIIATRSTATTLGDLSPEAWTEFGAVTRDMEHLLTTVFGAEKFNYLALMMKDPHVHFHLIPRYSQPVTVGDRQFTDSDWPEKTELSPLDLDDERLDEVVARLKSAR